MAAADVVAAAEEDAAGTAAAALAGPGAGVPTAATSHAGTSPVQAWAARTPRPAAGAGRAVEELRVEVPEVGDPAVTAAEAATGSAPAAAEEDAAAAAAAGSAEATAVGDAAGAVAAASPCSSC